MYEPDPAAYVGMLGIDPKIWERLTAASDRDEVHKWPACKEIKLKPGEKLWPEHVGLPSELVEGVCKDTYSRDLTPEEKLSTIKYTGAFAWRVTQGYYRFEPELERELLAQTNLQMSVDLLDQLPAKCVAICVGGILPIFVYFDYDITVRQLRLCQTALSRGGTHCSSLPIIGPQISDMLSPANASPEQIKTFSWLMPHILHLCSLKMNHSAKQNMPKNYLVTRNGAISC